MTHKIKCPNPKCGRDDWLSRTEQVYAQAYISHSDEVESGWDYDGESKIHWDTQGRDDTMTEPEFQCLACSTEFDWTKEDGPSNIQTYLCGNRECAEAFDGDKAVCEAREEGSDTALGS